jgi:hypothetical protein
MQVKLRFLDVDHLWGEGGAQRNQNGNGLGNAETYVSDVHQILRALCALHSQLQLSFVHLNCDNATVQVKMIEIVAQCG